MNRVFAAAFVRPKYTLSLLGLLASGTAYAQTEPGHATSSGHVYIAAAATGSALQKPRQTIANAPTPGATLDVVNAVDFGWGGQVAVGYAWRFVRIEAEAGRTGNHSSAYSAISPIAVTLPQDGENTMTRFMGNAYLELPRGVWPVSPFVGAGVGAVRTHFTTFAAPARAPAAPPSQLLDVRDTRFAYQVMAGLAVPVTPHVALTAQYRWFDGGTSRGLDSRGERATRTLRGSNFDVGVRFGF